MSMKENVLFFMQDARLMMKYGLAPGGQRGSGSRDAAIGSTAGKLWLTP